MVRVGCSTFERDISSFVFDIDNFHDQYDSRMDYEQQAQRFWLGPRLPIENGMYLKDLYHPPKCPGPLPLDVT